MKPYIFFINLSKLSFPCDHGFVKHSDLIEFKHHFKRIMFINIDFIYFYIIQNHNGTIVPTKQVMAFGTDVFGFHLSPLVFGQIVIFTHAVKVK